MSNKVEVPCKPDTIIFKISKTLDESIYSTWKNINEFMFFKKVHPFSLRYYSGAGILSIQIYSIPKFLYGFSQWEETDYLLEQFVDEVICFLKKNFEIDVSEEEVRKAKITRLDINKDFYFSSERNAKRFTEWLKLFEFKGLNNFCNYPSGFKRNNKSWNIEVYDKVVKCKKDKEPYILINNSVTYIRVEIQFKKGKMSRLPKGILNGTATIEKVFDSQETIDKFWEYFAENKLLFYPYILSKANMQKFAFNLNLRKKAKAKQQIVDYLMLTGSRGLKYANSKYSTHSHIINAFKHQKVCPVYMGLHILKDLIKTNNGTRKITNIIEP